MYKTIIKSVIDFSIAFLGLVILSPLIFFVTIGLFISNNGRPFFIQKRPGKNEKIFRIIKFKTMNDKKDSLGNLLSDEQRLTKIGSFVRKTSIDEIPQLFNVLKGDMSLIGPRPLLPEYLPLYNEMQKKRHEVKPGITGWAQINGRNAISWQQKFEYDEWYVENISFKLDCKILFCTLKKVIIRKDINLNNQVSSEYFMGNK